MSVVYIKLKGRDEIVFPGCFYEQHNNFVIIHPIDCPRDEVGAFNTTVVEYVYYSYEDNAQKWLGKSGKASE